MAAPTNFDTTRIRMGELVAGIAGVVLIISPFLDWFSISAKNSIVNFSISGSGWDALSWVPWIVTITGIVAIALAVMRAMGATPPSLPASPGFILLVLGGLSTIFVLFRILVVPDAGASSSLVDVGRSFGIFLAFIAAAAVTVGGWLLWNEEGKPRPGGAGRGLPGSGAGPGAPLGAGQQPPYGAAAPGAQPQQQAYAQPAAAAPAAAAPAQQPAAAAGGGAAAKADWYPDPRGEKRLRYWDGSQWTDHTAD